MKRILISICVISFSTNLSVFAQQNEIQTELLIIGVNHNRTKKINYKKLYQLLEVNKPDLILWEQSEGFEREIGLRTAYRLKIVSPTTEQLALQVFNKKNRLIPILGFDTGFSSKKKYINETVRISDVFFTKLDQSKLNKEDSLKYRVYVDLHNNYIDDFYNKSLEEINLPIIYRKAKEIKEMEFNVIIPIAKKCVTDSIVLNDYISDRNFGKARNGYMAQKILEIASAQKGKRIIVLTGLNHKYFLIEELSKQTKMNLKLLSLQ